jgi:hypothetical protein
MIRAPRLSTTAAAYFQGIYTTLDTDQGLDAYCRDTFKNGIVPDSNKDATDIIALDLHRRYLLDAKDKMEKWGIVQMPHALIDEYADRILAKIVANKRRLCKVNKKASAKKDDSAINWEDYWHDKCLGMGLTNRVLRDQLESAHARILLLEAELLHLKKE